MTPSEHYLEAERLLLGRVLYTDPDRLEPVRDEPTRMEMEAARVHAILALAPRAPVVRRFKDPS